MIIINRKAFSNKNNDKKDVGKVVSGVGGSIVGGAVLSSKTRNRLTGKIVRYHNTTKENKEKILKEGLKVEKANNPNSYTRRALPHLADDPSLNNKIYTSKSKLGAADAGFTREMNNVNPAGAIKELFGKNTLKIELDYDKDIKGSKRIENPELLGAKNWREYHKRRPKGLIDEANPAGSVIQSKTAYSSLGKGTHIFDRDIDSSKIVGGKGYKKRTIKDIKEYIKKNPKRFAKGAAPIVLGSSLIVAGKTITKKEKKKEK